VVIKKKLDMDINRISEEIVSDITRNASISEILLKTQVLSSIVDVKDFSQWVSNEQNGYPDALKVPEYRQLGCNVSASLTVPFHVGKTEMIVPVDAIKHKGAREMLSKVFFDSAAVEAERLAMTSNEGRLRKPTPAIAYQYVQEIFPTAHVEAVFQDLSSSSFATLIDNVKSRILNFVLGLNKEGIIQLKTKEPNNKDVLSKVYYQTFNNSMVNNDVGNITAENIFVMNQEAISKDDIQKLQMMFSRLNVLVKEEKDPMLKDATIILDKEIRKTDPKKSIIKQTLAVIKGLAMGVASNEIATIVNNALGIL